MALLRRPFARAELTGAGACGQDFYTAGGQRKNPQLVAYIQDQQRPPAEPRLAPLDLRLSAA